ncbi:hypothetical protein EJD96_00020 (plasmid) [Herbaspirillum seropedicae]|uniref:hypothetical protein n=1 Tax=Herbaspirillum seropedicae TaxID=964 RepID=UPI001122AC63|nr:hypothetical protein [Herbaspirillum seropedicae]QDD62639.1 hypothetical protein EJD96_00020 [Herbaspirillum seropedicae]
MGYYINAEIGYYEGDQVSHLDEVVPQRLNPGDVWDGTAWQSAPEPVPASVTQSQARRALLAAGKLAAVETAVAAADQDTQIVWQYAATVERGSPFVAALAAAVGLTDAQIDDLFRRAATFV